ncbi:MAG TPA: PLD nuclease N-terminal domain-containing protein [Candidatus Acidoferrales bacterium]|nr:PLD nuclease N-terminal domain-containing protein [Candidatus Acidoferrales bacterium]
MPDFSREFDQLGRVLPLVLPLLVLQLALLVLAAVDLFRDERQVRWVSKPVWALIIVFVNIVGPLFYFFFGREDT